MIRYARAPGDDLLRALKGPLASLLLPRSVAGLALDPQLREGNCLMLYCGLTRVLCATLRKEVVTLTAHKTYRDQPCAAGVLRKWQLGASGFDEAVNDYLAQVVVGASHVRREGAVQADWAAIGEPWVYIDREAVIGGGLSPSSEVAEAIEAVRAIATGWARVSEPKGANELDQLAVDPEGRLVLVELKDGGAKDVFYAPLQALRYAWEWSGAVRELLPELEALIRAKQDVGLLPRDLPALTGELRVAVAWGARQPSREVERRLGMVRGTVKPFLPAGIPDIEIWVARGEPLSATRLHL